MNESGHQFRRYVRRMVGRKIRCEALCECGWRSSIESSESSAWSAYCKHCEETVMRMFPREEKKEGRVFAANDGRDLGPESAVETREFLSPHPSVDPALVQAIDTVARQLLVVRTKNDNAGIANTALRFADINPADWKRVEARVAQLVKELDRGEGPFDAAYKLLKARAEREAD